jgi:hypothetical protein
MMNKKKKNEKIKKNKKDDKMNDGEKVVRV